MSGDHTYTFRFRNATTEELGEAAGHAPEAHSLAGPPSPTHTLCQCPLEISPVPASRQASHPRTLSSEFGDAATAEPDGADTLRPALGEEKAEVNSELPRRLDFGICPRCSCLRRPKVDAHGPKREYGEGAALQAGESGVRQARGGYLPAGAGGPKYLYGYVYFRQVPDPSNRRGFFQKSIVLVAAYPLQGLYNNMASIVAQTYFSTGETALTAACSEICAWKDPALGLNLTTTFLGRTLDICVPAQRDTGALLYAQPRPGPCASSALAQRHLDFCLCLEPVLTHVQLLWELVLCSSPILVFSHTPVVCSRVVLALTALTAPLNYYGDYRPFFTIYDPDCATFARKPPGKPSKGGDKRVNIPAILGVTNPYFDQAFAHWPTVVRIYSIRTVSRKQRQRHSSTSDAAMAVLAMARAGSPSLPASTSTSPVAERRSGLGASPLSQSVDLASAPVPASEEQPLHRASSLLEGSFTHMRATGSGGGGGGSGQGSPRSRMRVRGVDQRHNSTTEFDSSALEAATAARRPTSATSMLHRTLSPEPAHESDLDASNGGSGSAYFVHPAPTESPDAAMLRGPGRRAKGQGVTSVFKQRLDSDHSMHKALLRATPKTLEELMTMGAMLEESMQQLSRTFLIPLEQYVARLMPLKSAISPFKGVPTLKPFSPKEFLTSVQEAMPMLKATRGGDWLGLYADFIKSRNFRTWLSRRRARATRYLARLYLEAVIEYDLEAWAKERSDVEVVDVLLRIKEVLGAASGDDDADVIFKARQKAARVQASLPEDLRISLGL